MNTQEVIKLADDLVFAHTGKHLDNLQEAILKGVWQCQKYSNIAEDFHCSEGHIKDVSSQLWTLLSKVLGEEINKSNFRATIDRLNFSNISHFGNDIIHIGDINFCRDTSHQPKGSNSMSKEQNTGRMPVLRQDACATIKKREDLREMPNLNTCFDRVSELTTLQQWILEENTRVISILGMIGIGKTSVAVQLISQVKPQFDYVIWRSLRNSPPLHLTLHNLLNFLSNEPSTVPSSSPTSSLAETRSRFLETLQLKRCLIIFDDLQTLYSSGQLAGTYQPEYANHHQFFREIAESYHQSCFILMSREKPRDISSLESENETVKTLPLKGLDNVEEILREKALTSDENSLKFFQAYQGNPLWLKIVTTMIQDLFDGNVSDLLTDDSLFLGDLEPLLQKQFNRLSPSEQELMITLSQEIPPMSLPKIKEKLPFSSSELLKIMQSLERRFFLEKVREGEKNLFTISPVFKELLKSKHNP
jgi:hypothetical protein